MATLERPLKEGSVRTYQEKVVLGFPDILASEADADADTIYAAWNGGVNTANLVDGAVTTAKLADAPNGVTTGKLNDGAVTTPKVGNGQITVAKLASGAAVASYVNVTPGPNLVVGTTLSTVLTFPALIARQSVIGIAPLGATVEIGAGLAGNVQMNWFRGATAVGYQQLDVSNPTASILRVPLPGAYFYDFVTPGTYVYTLQVVTSGAGIFFKIGPVPGSSWVLAFA
jgi:hypothetical protein